MIPRCAKYDLYDLKGVQIEKYFSLICTSDHKGQPLWSKGVQHPWPLWSQGVQNMTFMIWRVCTLLKNFSIQCQAILCWPLWWLKENRIPLWWAMTNTTHHKGHPLWSKGVTQQWPLWSEGYALYQKIFPHSVKQSSADLYDSWRRIGYLYDEQWQTPVIIKVTLYDPKVSNNNDLYDPQVCKILPLWSEGYAIYVKRWSQGVILQMTFMIPRYA